jgi:hypothetical protein
VGPQSPSRKFPAILGKLSVNICKKTLTWFTEGGRGAVDGPGAKDDLPRSVTGGCPAPGTDLGSPLPNSSWMASRFLAFLVWVVPPLVGVAHLLTLERRALRSRTGSSLLKEGRAACGQAPAPSLGYALRSPVRLRRSLAIAF